VEKPPPIQAGLSAFNVFSTLTGINPSRAGWPDAETEPIPKLGGWTADRGSARQQVGIIK